MHHHIRATTLSSDPTATRKSPNASTGYHAVDVFTRPLPRPSQQTESDGSRSLLRRPLVSRPWASTRSRHTPSYPAISRLTISANRVCRPMLPSDSTFSNIVATTSQSQLSKNASRAISTSSITSGTAVFTPMLLSTLTNVLELE